MKRKVGKRLNGESVTLVPHQIIEVSTLPRCNFQCDKTAEYDFPTVFGSWGNGCEEHYKEFRASPNLGTGLGQMLVASSTVEVIVSAS